MLVILPEDLGLLCKVLLTLTLLRCKGLPIQLVLLMLLRFGDRAVISHFLLYSCYFECQCLFIIIIPESGLLSINHHLITVN